ncbi:MAG: hypothetical protein HWN67_09450 [Candidatus Helarchaeota archaeon]|nr:hypothetical protein [Candidatus Helarchaeota archaeon]
MVTIEGKCRKLLTLREKAYFEKIRLKRGISDSKKIRSKRKISKSKKIRSKRNISKLKKITIVYIIGAIISGITILFNILGSPYLLKNIEIEFYLNLIKYLDYEYGDWNNGPNLMMVWSTFSNYIRFHNVFTFQIIICPIILTPGVILYYYARK